MNCPFCQHANAATARACRVCGGPLRAAQPKIASIPIVAAPRLLAHQTFAENVAPLVAASFVSNENPRVCLVRADSAFQLWNAQSNEISLFSLTRLFHKSSLICCALATANFVVTGHENGRVRWHNFAGREGKSPSSHVGRVLALAANATHFYSGGSDGVICVTELCDKKAKSCALLEGLAAMATFAVSPNATSIAVGYDDGAVGLWRVNGEQTAAKLDWTRRGHNAPIRSLAFSPNGQMIVSGDKNSGLCLWAAQTSYQLPLSPGARSSHAAPAFSGDSRLLALANAKNSVAIFDVALGTLLNELPQSGEEITHFAFAPGAPWLLVAGAREIAIWSIV